MGILAFFFQQTYYSLTIQLNNTPISYYPSTPSHSNHHSLLLHLHILRYTITILLSLYPLNILPFFLI